MKSKFITHIVLEGCDGVGKDSIMADLWPKYNFRYRVLMRGELSDFVYSRKYNREFISTQRGLPFLYVLITKDVNEIRNQIIKRGEDVENELKKLADQELFKTCAKIFEQDYHIIVVDVTGLTIQEGSEKVFNETLKYINNLDKDDEPNEFNKMYIKGANKLGLKWTVRNNQPFLDGEMIMADAQLHNGRFETYDNRDMPHNLIFSIGYDYQNEDTIDEFMSRPYDFAYPINSKILVRGEIYDYIDKLCRNNLTLVTTDSKYIPPFENLIRVDKVFGDDYIKMLTQAKATFYCSRDLAYLEMMTVRCYEAVRANQLIFVDRLTDPECKILRAIHGISLDDIILSKLWCTENTLTNNYKEIIKNKELVKLILKNQRQWYQNLCKELYNKKVKKWRRK